VKRNDSLEAHLWSTSSCGHWWFTSYWSPVSYLVNLQLTCTCVKRESYRMLRHEVRVCRCGLHRSTTEWMGLTSSQKYSFSFSQVTDTLIHTTKRVKRHTVSESVAKSTALHSTDPLPLVEEVTARPLLPLKLLLQSLILPLLKRDSRPLQTKELPNNLKSREGICLRSMFWTFFFPFLQLSSATAPLHTYFYRGGML